MKQNLAKKFILTLSLLGISSLSLACIDQGIVKDLSSQKETITFSLNSDAQYQIIGKKHPFLPMIQSSMNYNKEICLTNVIENYPTQLVVTFDDFSATSNSNEKCVKKGFVRRVYVNAKYDWFHLEDGFSIRVMHRSKLTPELYKAAFSKKELCITEMNLDATDGTWGIPRKLMILN
jgi:hypothetical protein